METTPRAAQAVLPPSLEMQARRAVAAPLWAVRLRRAARRPGVGGAAVVLAVLAGFAISAWGMSPHPDAVAAQYLGTALFFAVSLAMVVELAALIPLAARRDLEALAGQLTLGETDFGRLRAALLRYPRADMRANAAVGAALGGVHVGVSVPVAALAGGDPAAILTAVCTVALWSLMVQTGAVFVANARLFSAVGVHATTVDMLAVERLRPFANAALRPMLLIMALLAAYPLMFLGEGVFSASTVAGVLATVFLAVLAVALPLRGIARRIAAARAESLARLDAAISGPWQALGRGKGDDPARLEALLALRERLRTAPALPVGLGVVGRGMVYLALPIVTWSGKGLAEAVLDRLF